MDGHAPRSDVQNASDDPLIHGYKSVRHRVIDIEAPGMREAIIYAVDRINRSEEDEHLMAELDIGMAESWKLLPE